MSIPAADALRQQQQQQQQQQQHKQPNGDEAHEDLAAPTEAVPEPEPLAAGDAENKQACSDGPVVPVVSSKDALPPLDSLKCKLCGDFFKDPMTLQCLHSFCRACLDKSIQEEKEEFRKAEEERLAGEADAMQEQKEAQEPNEAPSPRPITCPTCRDVLHLPPPEMYTEPFPNERLARIIKLVHETNVLCQNCSSTASEVECTTCGSYLCRQCWDITHSSPVFKTHVPRAICHSEMTKLPKCPQHVLNDLEFFCTDEEVGVCQVCLLRGDFVGRSYRVVSEIRSDRQRELEKGVQAVLERRGALEAARSEADLVRDQLDENLATQQERVRANFQAIRRALDARERETLAELTQLKSAKESVICSQITAIDKVLREIAEGIRNTKLVLDYSNDVELTYLSYVLQQHVADIANIPDTAPEPCEDCHANGVPCHCPFVSADLPVHLSENLPKLVGAYAAVPPAYDFAAIAHAMRGEESDEEGKSADGASSLPVPDAESVAKRQESQRQVQALAEGEGGNCTIQ